MDTARLLLAIEQWVFAAPLAAAGLGGLWGIAMLRSPDLRARTDRWRALAMAVFIGLVIGTVAYGLTIASGDPSEPGRTQAGAVRGFILGGGASSLASIAGYAALAGTGRGGALAGSFLGLGLLIVLALAAFDVAEWAGEFAVIEACTGCDLSGLVFGVARIVLALAVLLVTGWWLATTRPSLGPGNPASIVGALCGLIALASDAALGQFTFNVRDAFVFGPAALILAIVGKRRGEPLANLALIVGVVGLLAAIYVALILAAMMEGG